MVDIGFPPFDTTIDKTNHVLKQIEAALGWSKDQRNLSYHALRSVLHALRDRLPVDEAAQLAAQLPLLIRGIYYEGWDPSRVPMKLNRDQFFERIRREFPYEVEGGPERLAQTVLRALREYVTDGEWRDLKSTLPSELADVLP
jgi:uncharacterized protein (DUF2267 family)